jgi:hypothetical protein
VKASIDDADAKYAALWKLYVFVSDGLYYTGILNKLRLATTDGQAKHVTRLKNAEALVVAALEVIREDWSKFCRDQAESTERGKCLVGTMAPERLAALVGLWISLYKARETDSREKNPTLGLSEVDVKHYVHEWNTTGCPVEDKCRDIRYKYPISAAGVWAAAKQRAAGMPERKLVEFLEACGITDPAILSTAEFEQLVGQYTGATANRCDAAMREHDGKLNHSHLHLLWQSALRAHQAVAPPVKPVKTKLPRKDAVPVPAFGPKSRIDTEQFLLTLSKRMKGNVGDELQKNTVALAEIIHSYPPAMQSVCIEDIQNLVTKESKFVHNNMKLDEHIPRLRQAWDRIRDGKNEPPADPEEGSGEDSGE